MAKANCPHRWKMVNLHGGYLVIEGCFHCRQRISQFSEEPVPPIDDYREGEHFWSHLADYQASKFDLRCENCPELVRLRDVMAVMLWFGLWPGERLGPNPLVGSIARGIVRSRARRSTGAFVKVPLELTDPSALAALAMITTVVPGTVWTELAIDHSAVLLHVFDVDDEAAFVADFKARYERPLKEIFE